MLFSKGCDMKIRKIKIEIYRKFKKLIFWRKILFYVQRVRLSAKKQIIPVSDNEIIEPPDLEMWALYKQGSVQPKSLHVTQKEATAMQEVLNKLLKQDIKIKGPK